jgi:hypothetical protein
MSGDKVTNSQESTASALDAYTKGLPGLMEATQKQFTPNELAQLEAAKAVSPGYAKLQTQLYDTAGRDLNRIGTDIAADNQLATAKGDLRTIQSTGKDLVSAYNEAAAIADPEYYKNRAGLGNRISELLSAGSNLTEGEMAQLERGVNRAQTESGNAFNPSPSAIAAGAMTFGQAGQEKFRNAINQATNALPALKSGVDPFAMATGKTSGANTGNAQFVGAKQGAGDQVIGMGNNLLTQANANQRNADSLNANRQSGLQKAAGITSSLTGSLANMFKFS